MELTNKQATFLIEKVGMKKADVNKLTKSEAGKLIHEYIKKHPRTNDDGKPKETKKAKEKKVDKIVTDNDVNDEEIDLETQSASTTSTKKTSKKAKTETAKNENTSFDKASIDKISKYLTEYSKKDENFAKIYSKSKHSVEDCYKYVKGEIQAQLKSKTNCCVCVDDDDVFKLARHYYTDVADKETKKDAKKKPTPKQNQFVFDFTSDDDYDGDDLEQLVLKFD